MRFSWLASGLAVCLGAVFATPAVASAGGQEVGSVVSLPFKHHKWVFFLCQKPGQKRAGLYVQEGLNGKARLLLDPEANPRLSNRMPDDFCVSSDGRYLFFEEKQEEARYFEIHVLEVASGKELPDVLKWTNRTDCCWKGHGFYYSPYPKPSGAGQVNLVNEKVCYHRLGTTQDQDTVAYEDPAHPEQFYTYLTTFDERTLFLHIAPSRTNFESESFWFRDEAHHESAFRPIYSGGAPGRFFLCDNIGRDFLIQTTYKAPKGRVILVDPAHLGEADWRTVVAETDETLMDASTVGGKLLLTYGDGKTTRHTDVCSMAGKFESRIMPPIDGQIEVEWGRREDRYAFITLRPASQAAVVYLYWIGSREMTLFKPNF